MLASCSAGQGIRREDIAFTMSDIDIRSIIQQVCTSADQGQPLPGHPEVRRLFSFLENQVLPLYRDRTEFPSTVLQV